MTTEQLIGVGFGTIAAISLIFILGYLFGSLSQLSEYLTELKRESFENLRDIKALNKMQEEHDAHIAKVESLEKNYQEALYFYAQESEKFDNIRELFMRAQR